MKQDKNFDALSERFEAKISDSRKGRIRRAVIRRDLQQILPRYLQEGAICDLGAGTGDLAIELADQYRVTCIDISSRMMSKAKERAAQKGVENRINWINHPYQEGLALLDEPQQLMMCHALLEWLAEPELLIMQIAPHLARNGYLSLCYYNPDGRRYRNLIRGNFKWLDNEPQYKPDENSLTPAHPCAREDVLTWLKEAGFQVIQESGIRVFSDYVADQRGGLADPEQVLQKELEFSQREPFKFLGRYLHIIAQQQQ